MSESLDLQATFWSPIGQLRFPSLVKPTLDLSKNECWVTGLQCSLEDSDEMLGIVSASLADARRRLPQFPKTDKFKDARGREDFLNMPYRQATRKEGDTVVPIDGILQWSFKRKTVTSKGSPASPPMILDPRGGIVANPPEIGYGSVGRVAFKVFSYDNASKGVGFYLVGAQISKLADAGLDADAIEGDWDPASSGTTGSSAGSFVNPGTYDNDEVPF